MEAYSIKAKLCIRLGMGIYGARAGRCSLRSTQQHSHSSMSMSSIITTSIMNLVRQLSLSRSNRCRPSAHATALNKTTDYQF